MNNQNDYPTMTGSPIILACTAAAQTTKSIQADLKHFRGQLEQSMAEIDRVRIAAGLTDDHFEMGGVHRWYTLTCIADECDVLREKMIRQECTVAARVGHLTLAYPGSSSAKVKPPVNGFAAFNTTTLVSFEVPSLRLWPSNYAKVAAS